MGPSLTKEINNILSGPIGEECGPKNLNSIILKMVEDKEIIEMVNKCKCKLSTDCSDINMTIVKKVIDGIVSPLTFMCNLSFRTGTFPEKLKIAKV